jgi:hypothetical protein
MRKKSPSLWAWLSLSAVTILLLACAGCPVFQRQDTPVDEIKAVDPTNNAPYYVYVPSDYNPTQAYPLMVTLHGTHGFDDAERQVKEWKALAEDGKFIVLAPQVLSPQGIMPVLHVQRMAYLQQDDEHILWCMQEVKAKYHIDEQAVAISAFSAGGYPMFFTALKHPELFNALIGRAADWDVTTVSDIPVTDAFRRIKVFLFFGKTGVSPAASQWDVITRDCWQAYRYLYNHGCRGMKISPISGSHERRPDVAWEWWKQVLDKQRQSASSQAIAQPIAVPFLKK